MEERVEINNGQGKLVGCLGHINHKYLIILCHGYTSDKDFVTLRRIAALFNKNKISTLRFDFSGSGESQGSKYLSLRQQVADLESVIKYADKYQHIILIGHSLGMLPVCICSSFPNVAGIVSINGFFDGKIKLPQFRRVYFGLKIARWFIPRIRKEFKYFKQNVSPQRIAKPMLVITSHNDEVLDYKQSQNWYSQLQCPKEFIELPLSDHGLNKEEDSEMVVKETVKWINKISS